MDKYLVLKANGKFETKTCRNDSYHFLRNVVGGNLEHIDWIPQFGDKGIDIWINEEGKLIGLDPVIALKDTYNFVDVLNGDICFARFNSNGETLPLSDEDIIYIKEQFNQTVLMSYQRGCDVFVKALYVLNI